MKISWPITSGAKKASIPLRIGLHSGQVMSGAVGHLLPRYRIFGDTVNLASRMNTNGFSGMIHISQATFDALPAGRFETKGRGKIRVKGVDEEMATHWLLGEKGGMKLNETIVAKMLKAVAEKATKSANCPTPSISFLSSAERKSPLSQGTDTAGTDRSVRPDSFPSTLAQSAAEKDFKEIFADQSSRKMTERRSEPKRKDNQVVL